MKRSILLGMALALAAGLAGADEPKGEEYESTAESREILRGALLGIAGKEARVVTIDLPPGWVGERHYHTGDVFVFVREGVFVVDIEGEGRKTLRPGEIYHEAVNQVMQARNGADGQTTRILLFQIGDEGAPMMMRADDPGAGEKQP